MASTQPSARRSLSYHNNNVEFLKITGGGTAFDLPVSETDPSVVSLEMDIG